MSVATPTPSTAASGHDWPRLVSVCGPVLLVSVILLISPNFRMVSGPEAEPFGGDVMHEWTGGWVLLNGERSRLYDVDYVSGIEHDPAIVGFEWDHDGYLPMVYPPFWYVLVSPLATLPLPVAAVVWTLLVTACLVGAFAILRRATTFDSDVPAGIRSSDLPFTGFVVASILFSPLIFSLGTGQKGPLLLLLFSATFLLLQQQRPFRAGLVFGLVAFKPHLTLVIAFTMLFKRQWSFIAGGLVTGSVLVGLSFVAGADLCRDYFAICAGMGDYVHRGGYDLTEAHSWWGASQLLLAGCPDGLVKSTALAGSLVTLGLLVCSVWVRFEYGTGAFALQFAALVVATLLTSPHLYTYDLTLLLLPLAIVGAITMTEPTPLGRWRPALVALGVSMFVVTGLSPRIAAATSLQITVPLMLAFLVLLERVGREVVLPGASRATIDQSSAATSTTILPN